MANLRKECVILKKYLGSPRVAPAWIGAEDDCFLGFRLEGSHFSVAKVYDYQRCKKKYRVFVDATTRAFAIVG